MPLYKRCAIVADDKIIPFPLDLDRQFNFDQAIGEARNRGISLGIIVGFNEDDEIMLLNFGNVLRKDALWMGLQVQRHALGEPIE